MSRVLCRECCKPFEAGPSRCPACGGARLVAHPELGALTIAHIDCDAFYASVEKRDRPDLIDEPLIVGHAGGRGVVTTACYIARKFGVRSAMPMFQALERCPGAVVVPPDMAKYKEVSGHIRAIFLDATDVIEPVSLDEAYLDLSPENLVDGKVPCVALARIGARVEAEVGITVSIGLSANKFLAKLASELKKPRGYSVIGVAEAKAFLAPLPVSKIHGVGAATAARLEAAGVKTITDLRAISEMQLVTEFGKFGRRLACFAVGEDDRRVTPDRAAKSLSAETTFRQDLRRPEDLIEAARGLSERVAAHLARRGLAGQTVVLKLKTGDFKLLTRNKRLEFPTQKAVVLHAAAQRLIEKEADGRTFRLIGIGVDGLVTSTLADPPDLFGALE